MRISRRIREQLHRVLGPRDDQDNKPTGRQTVTPERAKAIRGLYAAGHSETRIARLSGLPLTAVHEILNAKPKAKLKGEALRNAVRDMVQAGLSGREIARMLGRTEGYISNIRRRLRS
jgi:DNA invertase Pin-like site-specific DNA recombinase